MTRWRITFTDGLSRVVMAKDEAGAHRVGLLLSRAAVASVARYGEA